MVNEQNWVSDCARVCTVPVLVLSIGRYSRSGKEVLYKYSVSENRGHGIFAIL